MLESLKLFVVVVVVGCLTIGSQAAVFDNGRADQPAPRAQTPFSFEDIFDPVYRARSVSAEWISDTEFLYRDRHSGTVFRYNAVTKSQTVFVDNTTFSQLQTGTYYVSGDQQFVLFAYDIIPQWRHSYFAKYIILEVSTKRLIPFPSGSLANQTLQYVGWAPSGHALAFAYGNNLYYQATPTTNAAQLTTNGADKYLFNGIPDWLYEEDVLGDRVTHYWSPNGRYILYAEINDTGVPLQPWPWYGTKDNVFAKTIEIAYPKAGDVRGNQGGPNSRATLYVVDTQAIANPAKLVPPPASLANVDHYFVQVAWATDSSVLVTWTNRVQNQSSSSLYDVTPATLSPVENLKLIEYNGWLEVPPATPWFIQSGQYYLTILPQNVSANNQWRNLALVSVPTAGAGTKSFLMTSAEEVEQVVGYDAVNKFVYVLSYHGDVTERHLLRIGFGGSDPVPLCITCSMPAECRFVSASFSPNGQYYLLYCQGPDVPTTTLRNRFDDADVTLLENNDELRAALATKLLPTRTFTTIPVGGGYTGRAEFFYPPGHLPGNNYPLLVYAYAGPGSQRVMKTFPIGGSTNNWLMYLKSTHKIGVASLDGRGSMAAGDKLKFEMYRRLMTVEIQDQIIGGEYYKTLGDVDTTLPLAIFGWSYGGGVAAQVIGDTSTTFQCGISVAPVTTKTYYDTAYTERYLGLATPGDNAAGYAATDVMNKVQNFRNKTFMIAHGTADDNVHHMHSVQLISALSDAGILFRQNLYKDQDHAIDAPGQSRHLYASMTHFLLNDCWAKRTKGTPSLYAGGSAVDVRSAGGLVVLLTALAALLTGGLTV